MTKIMYFSFLSAFATLAPMACQPSDEPEGDTDTTPECGEDETSVVPWCEDADRMIKDIWCVQCGEKDACEYEEKLDMVCSILTSTYGKLSACIDKEDAAHCQAELTRNACEEEIYRWQNACYGFKE